MPPGSMAKPVYAPSDGSGGFVAVMARTVGVYSRPLPRTRGLARSRGGGKGSLGGSAGEGDKLTFTEKERAVIANLEQYSADGLARLNETLRASCMAKMDELQEAREVKATLQVPSAAQHVFGHDYSDLSLSPLGRHLFPVSYLPLIRVHYEVQKTLGMLSGRRHHWSYSWLNRHDTLESFHDLIFCRVTEQMQLLEPVMVSQGRRHAAALKQKAVHVDKVFV